MTHTFHSSHARAATAQRGVRQTPAFTRLSSLLMLLTLLAVLCLSAAARSDDAQTSGQLPLEQLARDPSFSFLDQPLPVSPTLSGNYLAGRFAQQHQDWPAAHTYIGEVALRDNNNAAMLQRAFLLSLGAGRFAQAERLARSIGTQDPVADVAHIFLAAAALKKGEADVALTELGRLPDDGFGDFTKPLLSAWALAAKGDFTAALARIDAADKVGAEATFAFHRGMIADLAGEDQMAADSYLASMREGLSLHSALVIAAFFDRHGASQVSAKIYQGIDKLFESASTLGVTPENARNLPRPSATDGAALAVFDIASMLYDRRAHDSAQIYASLTHMLSPKMSYASLMLGDIAALAGQYGAALERYAEIGAASPLYWLSRLRTAEVYEARGDLDRAAAVLSALAQEPRTRLPSLAALGDIYRRQNELPKAYKAYDAAVAAAPDKAVVKGSLLFSRAMMLSRMGQWAGAEKDLQAALELQPDNPTLLNFIGYSWMERGKNVDMAFDYIRRALALKPDDGYILDSYGWALHRRGDTGAAIGWLEKAAATVPGDATILDHLGDAYWFAGRVTEAQFQWQRARDLAEDHAFRNGVDAKLRDGLTLAPQPAIADRRDAKI